MKTTSNAVQVTIELSNTTGKENIENLVQALFQPITSLAQVQAFRAIKDKDQEKVEQIIVDLDFLLWARDNEITEIEKIIKRSVSAHWQCEDVSCVFKPAFEFNKPVNFKSFFSPSNRDMVEHNEVIENELERSDVPNIR